jgi:serine/threonine protein kinase
VNLQSPAPGQVLLDYELLDALGAGGFSFVWRARHRPTGAVVAIKLPRVPEFVAQLRREALVASRFSDPQFVGVLEVHLDHDPPFLVMPYVEGADLETPDRAPEPRDIVAALRRFRQIVEVVARLHEAGFVHGDLKPGNVRVGADGVCYLLDLGLARHQVAARQTTTLRASVVSVDGKRIAGTLDYMAPEVMTGERPGASADVYALGVILHRLLCGRPPAFGVSPAALNPFLPPRTTDLLRAMLAPDPKRRAPDASWLRPAVDALIRAEERCLRRRNGHERRRIFQERMRTLARGAKVLLATGTLLLFLIWGIPGLRMLFAARAVRLAPALLVFAAVPIGFIGFLLGVTTINAYLLGIPEKTYKNRPGHKLWTLMMQ